MTTSSSGDASSKDLYDTCFCFPTHTIKSDTPYEDGFFTIELVLPPNYPFKPPEVAFVTKTYHPNIQQKDGKICSQILGAKWSPQIKIPEVLLIVRQMLGEPNLDSPLEEEVAKQFRDNKSAFNKTAKEWTKKHAKK
eukprot:TRINITY_DN2377_c0_g1_i1.p1 TRINITY_DN2377_c0_g1~~TRINITY_DN2377_c0_g1_i1.p1  ORF type:complete len:137 (+),score=35.59 TRINITY_DN2377_c0_g1_i1:97-507(+)